jgi:hypothetical protein
MYDSDEIIKDFDTGGYSPHMPNTPPPAAPTEFYGIRLRDLSLDVEPEQFIYGRSLIRGMLSVLGGSGGIGKSAYAMLVSISIALGKPLLAVQPDEDTHHIFEPHGTVMYYSLEDPMKRLVRQVKGIAKLHDINIRSLWDNLILQSGRDLPLVVARLDERGRLGRCDIEPIVKYLVDNNVVLLTVDPYANSFDGGDGAESGSDTMKIICDQWRLIAHQADCAVWLVHHFRKGGMAGEADAFRGSTTLQNAARVMETLTAMTKEDASALGLDDHERRQYMRLENAKTNLSAAPADGQWFRFNGVPLGNQTTKYPKGDVIGVPSRWMPVEKIIPWAAINTALNSIAAGCEGGAEFYSTKPQSSRRGDEVIQVCLGITRKQAKGKMDEWLKAGVLEVDTYRSPQTRRDTEKLVVNAEAKLRLQQHMAD